MNDDDQAVTKGGLDAAPEAPIEDDMPEGEETPPPGVRIMALIRWSFLVIAALVALASWWSYARADRVGGAPRASAQLAPKYHCPMHPQIVSDQPGECPICHMNLELISKGPATPEAVSATPPSSPGAVLDGGAITPPGTTAIKLTLDRIQSIGVRTAVATEQPITSTLRVTAVVAPTDQGNAEVHVRSAGFVEKIGVNETGVHVARGQLLIAVYSPEVYQAESELLTASKWTGDAGVRSTAAARRKLDLLGMSAGDIERVVTSGEAIRALPVYAPTAGTVMKKSVVLGSYVTPELALYEIEDLSHVYVIADVFQQDVAALHVGAAGSFRPAQGSEPIEARVDLVYPTVDRDARTTRVRMSVKNERGALRPGQYGSVEFAASAARKAITVPRDAVVETGRSTYVFVVEDVGKFTPRSVTLGGESGNDVIVASGLGAGERVVSGATFLIDSESRLQASASEASPVPRAGGPTTRDPGAGPSCDEDFDRSKYPDKLIECQKCTQIHHGMGSMEADCKSAIAKPWR